VLNATICEKTIQANVPTSGASDTQMVRLTWPLQG
jgi:hypothetical protein